MAFVELVSALGIASESQARREITAEVFERSGAWQLSCGQSV